MKGLDFVLAMALSSSSPPMIQNMSKPRSASSDISRLDFTGSICSGTTGSACTDGMKSLFMILFLPLERLDSEVATGRLFGNTGETGGPGDSLAAADPKNHLVLPAANLPVEIVLC